MAETADRIITGWVRRLRRMCQWLCLGVGWLCGQVAWGAVPMDEDMGGVGTEDEQREWRMMWYNVENLFHPDVDSVNRDTEFTPDGNRRWSYSRYRTKIAHIAQVITNAGGWEGLDIVGLCEVENRQCVQDLCQALGRAGYQAVHSDSPDPRGIDVALLYRSTCRLVESRVIGVSLSDGATTRGILYAAVVGPAGDTLHLFLCHMPSQAGGYGATAARRKEAKGIILQREIDSLQRLSPQSKIVVMGDMNERPKDDLRGMRNQMAMLQEMRPRPEPGGTHKYKGEWSFLDQWYVSEACVPCVSEVSVYAPDYLLEEDERYLDVRPRRTFIGMRYQAGYSDHLPILLRLRACP